MKEKDVRLVRLIENGEDLDQIVAERFARLVRDCAALSGEARVALSFDDREMPLYEILFSQYRHTVPWERLELFFTHERCVSVDHAENRFGRAQRTLGAAGVLDKNIHRIRSEEADLALAAHKYETELLQHVHTSLSDRPHLDLVLLGVGPEGRIACLEPDAPALFQPNCLVAPAKPEADPARWLTLTPAALGSAAHIWVLARGADMAAMVHEVLEGDYEPNLHPVQTLRPKTGELVWFVDAAAAQRLAVASKEFRDQTR